MGQMHGVNSSSIGRQYFPSRTCPYPLGSACLWVCRGVGDAHCAAVAVAGGKPDDVRQLFSIGWSVPAGSGVSMGPYHYI